MRRTSILLSVNLNAVAHLRNRRPYLLWPSVTEIGARALDAGAHGLTVHPRPDERHITRADVLSLGMMLSHDFPEAEFNIEGYPSESFLALCETVRPGQVTLVPDAPDQATSDHGWNAVMYHSALRQSVERLAKAGMPRVSLFIDADPEIIPAVVDTGAPIIELYTGPYGHTHRREERLARLDRLVETAEAAREAGLGINAGHDLTLKTLPDLAARIPFLNEVSIGHGLIADALIHGIAETVRLYRAALGNPVEP